MPRISRILQDNFCSFPDKTHLRKQLGSWAHNASSPFTHDGVLFRHYKPVRQPMGGEDLRELFHSMKSKTPDPVAPECNSQETLGAAADGR